MKGRNIALVVVAALVVAGVVLRGPIGAFIRSHHGAGSLTPAVAAAPAPDTVIVRPLTGTLHIQVPASVIGADYWVYVNEHLVSSPPRELTTKTHPGDLVSVQTSNGFEFWDAAGLAFKVIGSDVTFIRDDLKAPHAIFEDITLPIAPGAYEVSLMTAGHDGPVFPFSTVGKSIQVTGGATTDVVFGLPPHFASGASVAAARALPPCSAQIPSVIDGQEHAYQGDPVAQALISLHGTLVSNPPQQPTVLFELPRDLGGPREYDAAQIDRMIDRLTEAYAVDFPSDFRTSCRATFGSNAGAFDQVMTGGDDFNKRIQALRMIPKKLREAGEGGR